VKTNAAPTAKSPGRRRYDESDRRIRARAARLDKVAAGAGDALRDSAASALDTALARHEAVLTGGGQVSANRDPRGENIAG
jgi:hypothetical protein